MYPKHAEASIEASMSSRSSIGKGGKAAPASGDLKGSTLDGASSSGILATGDGS